KPSGSSPARFHFHNGAVWTHTTSPSSVAANAAVAASDRLRVAARATPNFKADVVCVGIKNADSSDPQIETLSRTAFQAWRNFAFNWLIGFRASLQSAGVLQDQSAAGTGDEISHGGSPTLVSDPAGWSWTGRGRAPPPRVPPLRWRA